jgi:hypothetical protein
MKTSTHVFAGDLIDEGFGTVLDTARDVAGLDGVVYAGIYHHAGDILPHDPKRKVLFHEGGAAYFRPSAGRFAGAHIQPKVSALVDEFDPLARLIDESDARAMTVRVWTNNLHNTAIGSAYPDCVTLNAFGDRYITSLCPANPDVRAHVRTMSAEIAGYGVPALILEAACYQPFAHGYHHARSHFAYTPTASFLLGLCICEHCSAAGGRAGVDADRLRGWVGAQLGEVLEGRPSEIDETPLDASSVGALAGGDLGGFLAARGGIVTSLVAETVDEVRAASATRVIFIDWSGGLVGYVTGGHSKAARCRARGRTGWILRRSWGSATASAHSATRPIHPRSARRSPLIVPSRRWARSCRWRSARCRPTAPRRRRSANGSPSRRPPVSTGSSSTTTA